MRQLLLKATWLATGLVAAASVKAAYLPIYGGPTYDANTSDGYLLPYNTLGSRSVNEVGQAAGSATRYVSGVDKGLRAVRWASSGAATELGNLGTNSSGFTDSYPYAINEAGQAVGFATRHISGSGWRAVRWDNSGGVIELGNLGTEPGGSTDSRATDINDIGQAAGFARKHVSGSYKGYRAVRWDSGGAAIELGNLGMDSSGVTNSGSYDINNAGQMAGNATKYVSGSNKGGRAVRWDSSGVATELGNLGTDSSGVTASGAIALNDSGQAAGSAFKYVSGSVKGNRAVRWESNGAALELANLGTQSNGFTTNYASDINNSGQVAGYCQKYVSGSFKGERAVSWDSSGAVFELANLGTDSTGFTNSRTNALNESGQAAGYADKYDISGALLGRRAVFWKVDGTVVDLNDLIEPSGGWLLTEASAISDTGWIAGMGSFDPDGAGGLAAYDRLFLLQIPEPASLMLLAMGGQLILRRHSRRNH